MYSNNKWFNYSFEQNGIWFRVYSGNDTSNPDGPWELIAPKSPKPVWKRLITWGAYSTVNSSVTLNESWKNFALIVWRFGYDTSNTSGAGGVVYRHQFVGEPDNLNGTQLNVVYYQDTSLRTGVVGFTDNTHAKILSSPTGKEIVLRCIYGVNFV